MAATYSLRRADEVQIGDVIWLGSGNFPQTVKAVETEGRIMPMVKLITDATEWGHHFAPDNELMVRVAS